MMPVEYDPRALNTRIGGAPPTGLQYGLGSRAVSEMLKIEERKEEAILWQGQNPQHHPHGKLRAAGDPEETGPDDEGEKKEEHEEGMPEDLPPEPTEPEPEQPQQEP